MTNGKSDVLSRIHQEWETLLSVLGAVPEERMQEASAVGDWSVYDLMGHITTWEQVTVEVVQKLLQGQQDVRYDLDVDAFNAQESQRKRDVPLETIRREFLEVHQQTVSFLECLPEAHFARGTPFYVRIKADTVEHYAEHAEDLRRWLRDSS